MVIGWYVLDIYVLSSIYVLSVYHDGDLAVPLFTLVQETIRHRCHTRDWLLMHFDAGRWWLATCIMTITWLVKIRD